MERYEQVATASAARRRKIDGWVAANPTPVEARIVRYAPFKGDIYAVFECGDYQLRESPGLRTGVKWARRTPGGNDFADLPLHRVPKNILAALVRAYRDYVYAKMEGLKDE